MNAMDKIYSAFTKACETGDLKEVKSLINSNPKLDICQYNENALSLAGHYGHLNVMKYLIETHHADVFNCETDMFETAAEFGFLDIVKYLVEECDMGTDIDTGTDTYGFLEALLTAANRGHANIVEYFIDLGIEYDVLEHYSTTKSAYEFCEKLVQEKWLEKDIKEASEMALKNTKKAEKLFKSNLKSLQKIGVKRPVRRRPSGASKEGPAK